MTKILKVSLCLILLLTENTYAQTPQFRLWGSKSTSNQMPGYGSIFSVNYDGTDFQIAKEFEVNQSGSKPVGALLQVSNGNLYGMTSEGGLNDLGVIYKLNSDGTNYIKLFDFSESTGSIPTGALIQGNDGKLYGVTTSGGINGYGVIFKIELNGTGFQKLFEFNFSDGSAPTGLIQASDGKLYGMTKSGGANYSGVVFKIETNGSDFNKLFDVGASGQNPCGKLLEGADGYLYGLTGNIFKINKDGTGYFEMHKFGLNGDGRQPQGTLLQLPSNVLIGVTSYGGANDAGTFFSIDPNGTGYSTLYDFSFNTNGGIILASDGKVYGTAGTGESENTFIYSITTDGSGYSDFFQFSRSTRFSMGARPSSLIEILGGQILGITLEGGESNNGTIFKLTLGGSLTKLKDFPQEGSDPEYKLTQSSNGYLYGCTLRGGVYGYGTVFRIQKDGTGFQKLFDFDDLNTGSTPTGSLLILQDGYLYGTTRRGGANSSGTIFKLKLDGTGYIKIRDFPSISFFGGPSCGLTLGTDGYLYGTTNSEGLYKGILYKILPNGTDYQTIVDFTTNPLFTGSSPSAIKFASDGKIYGITNSQGANDWGTIFRVEKDGSDFEKIHDFDFSNLGNFVSRNEFFETTNGQLIGATFFGGTNNGGTIFSINKDGSGFETVFDFEAGGEGAVGGLTQLVDGELFGNTTRYMFKIRPDGSGFEKFFSFGTTYDGMLSNLLPIQKQSQTISFNPIVTPKRVNDTDLTLVATSSSGLPISFTSSNLSVATVSGNVIKIIAAGMTTITAIQSGNVTYATASSSEQTLVVEKVDQTITFNPINNKVFGDAVFELFATSNSGLSISYLSSDETIASISGNKVAIVGAGLATITARQLGDKDFNSAADISQILTINKANQLITFNSLPTKTLGDTPFNLSALASSNLSIQYSSNSDKIGLSENQVTLVKAGSVTIKADQNGNNNFNSATTVSQSFCINPAKPLITITGLDSGSPILTSSSSFGNQWFRNGASIENAISNTFSPTDDGSYTVRVSVDNCSSEFSGEQILVITGDLNEATVSDFIVYPNPVTHELTVNLTSFDSSVDVEIVIYDPSGKIIEKSRKRGDKIVMSVSSYSKGVYVINATQFNRHFATKFIKE